MTSIIVRDLPKSNGLESANLYIKDAVVFYASVHEPKKKYNSEDKEFGVTVFIDEETKDKLLDEVMVNKTFSLVGKDKTNKPPRRIKFPLSSQAEEGKVNYDVVDGMYGFNVAKAEFSKKGNKMFVNVIDKEGNDFKEDVGNGSVCTLKLFGYRNQDGQLCVSLDTLQVLEHVPYEGKSSSGEVADDVLGVSYKAKKAEPKDEATQEQNESELAVPSKSAKAKKPEPTPDSDDFNEDLPF